jgi:hypothetical protein
MTNYRRILNIMAVGIFTLVCVSAAQAQATRTWVSGVGDDANPCSRTAPCKTFAGAISKTAASGEIDCIDPGGFGAVTITKSVTIDGGGTFGSILAAGTNGVIVNDAATATPGTIIVALRNLSINGAGSGLNGIRFLRGKQLVVENVQVFGFTQNGIDAPLSGVPSGSTGAFMYLYDVHVSDLRGAASVGINASAVGGFGLVVATDRVRTDGLKTGAKLGNNTVSTIRNSMFWHGNTGIEMVSGSNAVAQIEGTMLTFNGTNGMIAGSGTTTRLSEVSIIGCFTAIQAGGGTVHSSGNNRILDNTNQGVVPTIITPQ